MTIADSTPFPCPFCQSTRVVLVGGGLVFLHYECSACHEVWTAMAVTPKIKRHTAQDVAETTPTGSVAKTEKIWLN